MKYYCDKCQRDFSDIVKLYGSSAFDFHTMIHVREELNRAGVNKEAVKKVPQKTVVQIAKVIEDFWIERIDYVVQNIDKHNHRLALELAAKVKALF